MRKVLMCLLLCFLSAFAVRADADSSFDLLTGDWGGKAIHGDQQTDIAFHFTKNDAGDVTVAFDLPRTNVESVPLGKIKESANGFQAGDLPIYFHLEENQTILAGEFVSKMKGMSFKLKKDVPVAASSKLGPPVATAQPVWTFQTKSQVWSSPSSANGIIYFGSNDGNLYALTLSGKLLWSFASGGAIFGRPTCYGEYVYFLSDSGFLFKLDGQSGKEMWRFDTGGGAVKRSFPSVKDSEYDYFSSSAVVDDGTVFIGSANGILYAINESSGKEKWRYQANGKIRSTPAVYAGMVCAGSWGGSIFAVDKQTGALKWQYDVHEPVVSSPVYANGTIYIGSRNSNIFALDSQTGREKWRYFYWLSWVESTGTLKDKVLYIGSSDYQQVLALDTQTQRAVWSFDTDGSAWGTPAVTDNTVYIGAVGTVGYMTEHHGAFFALDRKTGREEWRFVFDPIPDSFAYGVASSPAVVKNLIIFGSLDGKVYAFPAHFAGGAERKAMEHSTELESQEIRKAIEEFRVSYAHGDINRLLDYYSPDLIKLRQGAPDEPFATTASRVRATFERYTTTVDVTVDEIIVDGSLAFTRGTFVVTLTPKTEGEAMRIPRRYLEIWRKENGRWRVFRTMDNTAS